MALPTIKKKKKKLMSYTCRCKRRGCIYAILKGILISEKPFVHGLETSPLSKFRPQERVDG